ncbi:MAG: hypothetical protein HKO57_07955 [Akkermansiaceae bacterium]|nr:hypothetical protein [Akkermansiaceae bacterium]
MDLRRHKPRRQRLDEDAGLVFAWRVPGGSLFRTVLAVLITAGLFAGATVAVNVKPHPDPVRMQDGGSVTLLWPDDPAVLELLSAADVDSPFPDRWEPQASLLLNEEIRRLGAELETRGAYRPLLRPRLDQPRPPELPGLLGEAVPPLPPPVTTVLPPPTHREGDEVYVRTTADDGLAGRWTTQDVLWEGDQAESLLGREAGFLLGVDPAGTVEFCLAIDTGGLDSELVSLLANWLRQPDLAPADEQAGTQWGVIRVSFGTKHDTGEENP